MPGLFSEAFGFAAGGMVLSRTAANQSRSILGNESTVPAQNGVWFRDAGHLSPRQFGNWSLSQPEIWITTCFPTTLDL
jgi:hypothetical protein